MNDVKNFKRNNKTVTVVLLATMFLVIVFPNTFRALKVALLAILVFSIKDHFFKMPKKAFTIYLLGIIITIIYLLVGLGKATQPLDSTLQVTLVYVLSPLLWLLLSFYIIKNYSIKSIVNALNLYAIIGSSTVVIGIWLYNTGHKDILEYVIENPNQSFTDTGVSAIRFHVYGSLIFLYPAIIELYSKFKAIIYILILVLIVIVSIVSGRDALMLATIVGFFLLTLLTKGKFLKYSVYLIPAAFLLFLILEFYGVNMSATISLFIAKVQAGGSSEIPKQFNALMEGIDDNHLLGAGHGVGVKVIRSTDYPWRYEVLPVATIFRVGIIGFIIYAYPAITATVIFVKKFFAGTNTHYDNYFFAGLMSLCMAAFTNPYLESFEFQWGYFFVFIYFLTSPVAQET